MPVVTTYLGVDPGVNGALAILVDGELVVHDLPTVANGKGKGRREIDAYELARIIAVAGTITHAFVEKVGAMPTDGSIQAFSFGQVFGTIRGVLSAHFMPITLVSPIKWRNALGVRRSEKRGDKQPSVDMANQLFPKYNHLWRAKCHADRAEAALIAEYCRRTIGSGK